MASVRKIETLAAVLPRKKRVAAYARVSSGKDAMLHSLSAQVSYYSDYIQRRPDWEYAGVYADEALTGTRDTRPEFRRLLADCFAGKVNMVITKTISRFARNTMTLLKTTRDLKEIGVTVFFERESLYSDSAEGEMILTLLAAVAQEESRAVSENCKWRIRNRYKQGDMVSLRFLYGYRITKNVIEPEPEETETVRWIFNQYLNGTGCSDIARQLRARNAPTLRGGKWTAKRVIDILKNEKYAGNALLQKKYIVDHLSKKESYNYGKLPRYFVENTHPPIVEPALYNAVQVSIEKNRLKNNIAKEPSASYPFTGMITCEACGKAYIRKTRKGIVHWQCSTYLREGSGACPAKQIPDAVLKSLAAELLGLNGFREDEYHQRVSAISVPAQNKIRFVFTDGHETVTEWTDRSRSEVWTDEMRQQARERRIKQLGGI